MKWRVVVSGPLEKEPVLKQFADELEKYFDVRLDVKAYYKMVQVRINGVPAVARPHTAIRDVKDLRKLFWPFYRKHKHHIRQRILEKR